MPKTNKTKTAQPAQPTGRYRSHPLSFYEENLDKLGVRGLTGDEQETVIVLSRNSDKATVSVSDNLTLNKIRKKFPYGGYKIVEVSTAAVGTDENGQPSKEDPFAITEIVFEVDKKLVKLARVVERAEMSEEQREAARARMAMMRNRKSGVQDDESDEDDEET